MDGRDRAETGVSSMQGEGGDRAVKGAKLSPEKERELRVGLMREASEAGAVTRAVCTDKAGGEG